MELIEGQPNIKESAAQDAILGKMWSLAFASGKPEWVAAVAAIREATQGERIAALREGEAQPQATEPDSSQGRGA